MDLTCGHIVVKGIPSEPVPKSGQENCTVIV